MGLLVVLTEHRQPFVDFILGKMRIALAMQVAFTLLFLGLHLIDRVLGLFVQIFQALLVTAIGPVL